MKYQIETKNKEYTGVLSTIRILNGIGEAEDLSADDIQWLEKYEHTVTLLENEIPLENTTSKKSNKATEED